MNRVGLITEVPKAEEAKKAVSPSKAKGKKAVESEAVNDETT